jgi:hypothetical protein
MKTTYSGTRVAIIKMGLGWFGPHSIVKALARSGVDVCIIAPPKSYLAQSKYYKAKLLLEPEVIKNSIASILDSLAKEFNPSILLAGDDIAFQLICKFINDQNGSEKARELLAKSFPGIEQLNTFATESMFIKNYASFKCIPPPSIIHPTLNDIFNFINKYDFPVALKEDGCWAGNGVTICNSIENIESKFNSIENKPFLIQKVIDGVSSQVGLSGIYGEVSGYFSFKKIEHTKKNGPASVIEFLSHKPMLETAKAIYKQSCFTGFCGIDFIIDKKNKAWLLELNPRIMPSSHLGEVFGFDLVSSFISALKGQHYSKNLNRRADRIALFPNELLRNPRSHHLTYSYHDVPWDDPGVLKTIINNIIRHNGCQ